MCTVLLLLLLALVGTKERAKSKKNVALFLQKKHKGVVNGNFGFRVCFVAAKVSLEKRR
jgi:hypothetical protein